MISYYGVSNPALQKSIIDLCFYGNNAGVYLIDEAIINDTLSGEQLRMLPMFYIKSDLNNFSLIARSRIKGMYKHTLCRNHSLLVSGAMFQKKIYAAGYKKVIFLKGVAHLLYAKKNLGQRPMADIDILIPDFIENIQKSMSFIKDEGYEIKSFGVREVSIVDKNNNEFDIHWYLNHGALKKITVDKILSKSVTINYLGNDILVPCYEHQLAHLLVHGIFASTLTYDARWVVDVVDLLSLNEQINPEIFLDFIADFTLPSKIKYGIDLILNNVNHELQFDRKSLEKISVKIQSKNHLLEFFYKQRPRPNINFFEEKNSYSWIKSGICTHIIEPLIISRYNKVPFKKSLGLTFGFPPPSMGKVLFLMLEKIFQRLFHRARSIISKL
jgi:hypothetical protein